jgi:hypothetical protein
MYLWSLRESVSKEKRVAIATVRRGFMATPSEFAPPARFAVNRSARTRRAYFFPRSFVAGEWSGVRGSDEPLRLDTLLCPIRRTVLPPLGRCGRLVKGESYGRQHAPPSRHRSLHLGPANPRRSRPKSVPEPEYIRHRLSTHTRWRISYTT